MKRISFLFCALALLTALPAMGQDAATEERLNKLSGRIDDLIAGQEALKKHIESLSRELSSVREQASKPTGNYAVQEDVKKLADAIQTVDRKRVEDNEKTRAELVRLANILSTPTSGHKKPATTTTDDETTSKPPKDEKGYSYTIQSGDTLSVIVQAYREKNIKVNIDQILKANPGLKPDRLKVGQTIWIPAAK